MRSPIHIANCLLIAFALPFLLFIPAAWPVGAIAALCSTGLGLGSMLHHASPRSEPSHLVSFTRSADILAVLALLVLGVLGVAQATISIQAGLPRLLGLLLAVATYVGVRGYLRAGGDCWLILLGLSVSGGLVAAVGLVGTAWPDQYSKAMWLWDIYQRLPRLVTSVESAQGRTTGLHPNEVGAVVAMLLPLVFASVRLASTAVWNRRVRFGIQCLSCFAGTLLLIYLVLSVSRAAWVAALVGVFVMSLIAYRRSLLVGLTLGIAGVAGLGLVSSMSHFSAMWTDTDFLWDRDSWGRPTRYQIWSVAVGLVADYPVFGVGLNMFPDRAGFQRLGDQAVPHAHNLYLQTALDFGLLGLASFAVLVVLALKALVEGIRVSAAHRTLGSALAGAVAAHLSFGLVDAVAVGAKPTFLSWAILAAAMSLPVASVARVQPLRPAVVPRSSGSTRGAERQAL